jgi:DNA-binding NtrC family response regulator
MARKKNRLIFVVEDNKIYNRIVSEYLQKNGFTNIKSFISGKECLEYLKKGKYPEIVLQDYTLGDMTGVEVLRKVKGVKPQTEFVFLTANESVEVAVNTIKYGAYDYIIKDVVALDKVINKVNKIGVLLDLNEKNKQIKTLKYLFILLLIMIVVTAIVFVIKNPSFYE